MIGKADTIGVFQIESRAQMSMLPYLRPRDYYDLVVEVSIVRPGPIQGGMVKPYLENGKRPATRYRSTIPAKNCVRCWSAPMALPIFQEQVMQLSIVAAGFTAGEADQLRRSMANWERRGGIEAYEQKLLDGMLANGYEEKFARQIVAQIRGFSDYGFPEAHAASFALLAYVSAWLKFHHPAVLTAALLNSQPMGFYQPAQLVGRFARRIGKRLFAGGRARERGSIARWSRSGKRARLRCGWGCAVCIPFPALRVNVSSQPGTPHPSTVSATWAIAPRWRAATWKPWPRRARWPVSTNTGTWLSGWWRVTCRRCRPRRTEHGKRVCRCCVRLPRPRT